MNDVPMLSGELDEPDAVKPGLNGRGAGPDLPDFLYAANIPRWSATPNSDLLPSLLFKINQNQLALDAAIMDSSFGLSSVVPTPE